MNIQTQKSNYLTTFNLKIKLSYLMVIKMELDKAKTSLTWLQWCNTFE